MAKSSNKPTTEQLINTIYRVVFDILEDETGHPSYRKYLDKVISDIFELEAVGTKVMMAHNQFKCIKRLIKDPDAKAFCQMMLRDEDTKSLKELVRVVYDAAQIANKPKKRITSKDIKNYKYLTDLYIKGVKKLRKKYNAEFADNKKTYKTKYSNLNRLIGSKNYDTPHYSLSDDLDDDFDESLEDLISDPDDEYDYDDETGFDLSDLPMGFTMGQDGLTKIIKDNIDESNYVLCDEDPPIKNTEPIEEKLLKYLLSNEKIRQEILKETESTEIGDSEYSETTIDSVEDTQICPNQEFVIEDNSPEGTEDTSVTKLNSEHKEYNKMSTEELITEFNDQNTIVNSKDQNDLSN